MREKGRISTLRSKKDEAQKENEKKDEEKKEVAPKEEEKNDELQNKNIEEKKIPEDDNEFMKYYVIYKIKQVSDPMEQLNNIYYCPNVSQDIDTDFSFVINL